MPSIATRAVKNSDLQIQHQCPQCGAPASLLESDRLFSCTYCRVKSYLLAHGYFQYRLPHKAPADRELIYFPYWRFKGMLFSCLPGSTHDQFIDTSHQACFSPRFPASLGLRSQALTLSFVTADTPGHFIAPQTSLQDVMAIFNRRFNRELSQPLLHQAHIGETVSMIYAPYYLDRGLVDAVLNQPLREQDTTPFHREDFPGGVPTTHFHFIPTLCPHCGWDLDGTATPFGSPARKALAQFRAPIAQRLPMRRLIFLSGGSRPMSMALVWIPMPIWCAWPICRKPSRKHGKRPPFDSGCRPSKFDPASFCV